MITKQLPSSSHLLTFGFMAVGSLLLTGCSDRVMVAEEQMTEIRNSPAQPVEPPPQPELVEDYVYDADDLRSPFLPQSLLNLQNQIENDDGVTLDLTRVKEPLEDYELSQLIYHGMIVSPEGVQYGLIRRPDGLVQNVKVGDYMGANNGRIVEITSTQVNLIEIVPDNRGRYVEKPASLTSSP